MSDNTMQWIAVDENNLPEHEVLAANFMPDTFGYQEKMIGWIDKDNRDGYVFATSENERLDHVTHYIDINKFDLIQ